MTAVLNIVQSHTQKTKTETKTHRNCTVSAVTESGLIVSESAQICYIVTAVCFVLLVPFPLMSFQCVRHCGLSISFIWELKSTCHHLVSYLLNAGPDVSWLRGLVSLYFGLIILENPMMLSFSVFDLGKWLNIVHPTRSLRGGV